MIHREPDSGDKVIWPIDLEKPVRQTASPKGGQPCHRHLRLDALAKRPLEQESSCLPGAHQRFATALNLERARTRANLKDGNKVSSYRTPQRLLNSNQRSHSFTMLTGLKGYPIARRELSCCS